MSFLAPKAPPQMQAPAPPPPPPAYGEIQGKKPGRKPMSPTMLGAWGMPGGEAAPSLASMSAAGGQKTMLGQ